MGRLELLNQRQDGAVATWIGQNGIGTINAAVGFGKNFTAFKCLERALAQEWITPGDKVWFFAETNAREDTLYEELEKYKKISKVDLKKLLDFEFHCYQANPEGYRMVDIYDEIHDALTPKYKKNIENSPAKYKIGLSATIPKNTNLYSNEIVYKQQGKVYQTEEEREKGIETFINKGQVLEQLCPICFTYTLEQGIEEGILSPFQTYVIEHKLDKTKKNIKLWKSKEGFGSEYDYYTKRAKMKSNWALPVYMRQRLGKEMTIFLYNLDSKVEVAKALLNKLEGKTIIFGTRLDHLEKITPNVVREKNFQELRDKFNSDEIKEIASSKKLKQGITLKGITNCIVVSYFSKSSDIVQQLGRIVRHVEGKIANLYIFVTNDTFEEKWFEQMQNVYNEKGKLEDTISLNIVDYISSKSLTNGQ